MATGNQLRATLPPRDGSPSRLQLAHALTFACGLFGTLAGVVTHNPYYFLVAGPCLSISGALILLGSRITFHGPVGNTLRAVLGASRVRRLNLQGLVWLVAGILISAWGVDRVRHRPAEPVVDEPAVGVYFESNTR